MQIVTTPIKNQILLDLAKRGFGNMVKGVVDVEKKILALDSNLHSDLEAFLLASNSKQQNLWGINLYPELTGDDFVEFDSMINIRPHAGNMSRNVENPDIQKAIRNIISDLIR